MASFGLVIIIQACGSLIYYEQFIFKPAVAHALWRSVEQTPILPSSHDFYRLAMCVKKLKLSEVLVTFLHHSTGIVVT